MNLSEPVCLGIRPHALLFPESGSAFAPRIDEIPPPQLCYLDLLCSNYKNFTCSPKCPPLLHTDSSIFTATTLLMQIAVCLGKFSGNKKKIFKKIPLSFQKKLLETSKHKPRKRNVSHLSGRSADVFRSPLGNTLFYLQPLREFGFCEFFVGKFAYRLGGISLAVLSRSFKMYTLRVTTDTSTNANSWIIHEYAKSWILQNSM